MTSTGHLSVIRGKRVKVFMKRNNHFLAKFKERRGRTLDFFDHESVDASQVRTLTILRDTWQSREFSSQ